MRIETTLASLAKLSVKPVYGARALAEIPHSRRSRTMQRTKGYEGWTRKQLVERITELEEQGKQQVPSTKQENTEIDALLAKKAKPKKTFDFTRYNTRFIALKFAYLGQKYNGYEHHANNVTPLPTIEEVLWKALTKTKLIGPEGDSDVSWEGCEYAKCGRTDKGVSAFGQVISLRVRSNRPKPQANTIPDEHMSDGDADSTGGAGAESPFDPIQDEIPYARLLNRVLPDDIRILAWCPTLPKDFSARFSCRERRYRYFFTQPAYTPRPDIHGMRRTRDGSVRKDGWLDIAAMQEAASHYIGLHDFRNLCKLDAGRQITNFERRVTYAGINEAPSSASIVQYVNHPDYASIPPEAAKVYTFSVHGSAFLYHQVRHMVAVLFLVGLGLEKPSVVQELLDVRQNPTKPMYEMADDAPLVLWDCIFPDLEEEKEADPKEPLQDSLHWIYPDEQPDERLKLVDNSGRFGPGGVQEVLWSKWRQTKIDEILAASLLDVVAAQCRGLPVPTAGEKDMPFPSRSTRVFDGGNNYRFKGEYVPLMQRERMDSIETINARYLGRKQTSVDSAAGAEVLSQSDL